ncbi:restriction endonuclease subunit S [Tenacibaculum finnmarkense]|uniref:restriction endonuclease subunit S n=1 Tax=Tenacibaculum finnmarkense TaxID=2781243 RepID=UPI001EFB8151|nr:restriction endonuclease subunit S [Tenacibaculum finnmarkense]MCG8812159.1 restriction endonuclease subunit S [Tenacibaculum finnmarkense]
MEIITKNNIKKYSTYKNSGVEWLGEIPEHWEVKKFKFILNQSKGLTITKQNLINEGVFCVNYGEIHSKYGFQLDTTKHKLKYVDEKYLTTDINSLLNKGDFIFADTSEDIEGSGNFTHLISSDKTFAGYHTVIARPKTEIISLFFAFIFDSIAFRNQIRRKVKGVKVYSITQSVLKETTVWFPPLSEQTKIAEFLDDKTKKIDEAIAIKTQQINLLKERKQILIHKAVTRGLDTNVKLKNSGVEWIGEIPVHWEVKRLKHITTKIVDGAHFTPTYVEKGIPFLRVTDLSNPLQTEINWNNVKYIPLKEHLELIKRANPEKGDILLSKNGTIGLTKVINWNEEFSFFVSLCLIKPTKVINSNYFELFFNSPLVDKQITFGSSRTSVTNLHLEKIKELIIVLPPLKEQSIIINNIKEITNSIDKLHHIKLKEIEKLKEYKSSLINSVVTGKVRVC